MKIEIDIPEHHYNNIMSIDSVSLGRVPYKGIIMYTINAIKHGRVLEQKQTTKNDLGVDCIVDILGSYTDLDIPYKRKIAENILTKLPSVTPQEPKTGHWIEDAEQHHVEKTYHCSECGHGAWGEYEKTEYCGGCGAKMVEPQESEE
jgi:hypothetical protein